MSGLCRICLAGQAVVNIQSIALLEVYENLVDAKINASDGRPRSVCCYCYQKLIRCYCFSKMARKSVDIFTQLVQSDINNEVFGKLKHKPYLTQTKSATVIIEENEGYCLPFTIKEEPNMDESDQSDSNIVTGYVLNMTGLCRICLSEQAGLNKEMNTALVDVYKRLTNSVNTNQFLDNLEEGIKPKSVCCYCYRKLQKCYNFSIMARISEDLFTKLLREGMTNEIVKMLRQKKICLSRAPLQRLVIDEVKCIEPPVAPVTVKEEPATLLNMILENNKQIPVEFIKMEIKSEDGRKKIIKHPTKRTYKLDINTDQTININVVPVKNRLKIPFKTPPKQKHICHICNKEIPDKHRLKVHLKMHSGERPYSCDFCGKRFRQKQHLSNHEMVHTGEKPYGCEVCEKRYREKTHLKRHMRVHTGLKPHKEFVKCEVCNKDIHKHSMVTHLRVHTKEKPFECPKCDMKFASKYNFEFHFAAKHAEEKPYACSSCDQSFNMPFLLKRHMRKHFDKSGGIKERTYRCAICNNDFTGVTEFNIHKSTHGEKPFICDICDNTFKCKSHLKKHLYLHSKKKNHYSCKYCDRPYMVKYDLKLHMKNIHKERM